MARKSYRLRRVGTGAANESINKKRVKNEDGRDAMKGESKRNDEEEERKTRCEQAERSLKGVIADLFKVRQRTQVVEGRIEYLGLKTVGR